MKSRGCEKLSKIVFGGRLPYFEKAYGVKAAIGCGGYRKWLSSRHLAAAEKLTSARGVKIMLAEENGINRIAINVSEMAAVAIAEENSRLESWQ
jgi:hypothetical protein